jgi:class 3 adenylate cyclase
VDRYRGLLAATVEHFDDAIAHYEAALDVHHRMGARPWLARTRYDLARALVGRGGSGDRERALFELNTALDTANEIGMPRLIEEALEVKLELQGIDPSSSQQLSIDAVAAAVSLERPDLRRQAAADGTVTLLFTDIEGYSELTERLGDVRSQEVLHAHGELVEREVAAHAGTIVKSQGDGYMIVFPTPAAAMEAAVAIRAAIEEHDFGANAGRVRVRMGAHAGETIREGDDFYGRTVILASRVAAAARGGEILASQAVRNAVGHPFSFGDERELPLKGLRGTHRVYTLT